MVYYGRVYYSRVYYDKVYYTNLEIETAIYGHLSDENHSSLSRSKALGALYNLCPVGTVKPHDILCGAMGRHSV